MKDDYQNLVLKLQPCQTAEEVKALLEANKKGRVKNTMQNVYTVFGCDPILHGAISRVFKPGCKFEQMLCLVGGQGAGKSTFFRFLTCKDEWFSDDLKRIDDENVFRKMQGHWIIEMSEMIATANAKSIEDIKSFLSRQKETYKVPYATEPEDRLRQCVFGGTSNALDFLPLDRSGNCRFLPIMVHPEQAEVHILEDEPDFRQYMEQLWAEAMTLYRQGNVQLKLTKAMNADLVELQKQFMPEDTKVGVIQAFLDTFDGDIVCCRCCFRRKGRFSNPIPSPETKETKNNEKSKDDEESQRGAEPRFVGGRFRFPLPVRPSGDKDR